MDICVYMLKPDTEDTDNVMPYEIGHAQTIANL